MAVFALGCLCLLPGLAWVALHLPTFGAHPLPYGDAVDRVGPARKMANMVSAVNFDIRGFDTLGEEFMLLCAVTGVTVLLRGSRGEQTSARAGRVDGRPILPPSEAVRLLTVVFGPITLVYGLYIALHAMTTPGGGFQGGVIAASGLLLILLGLGYRGWRSLVRSQVMDGCEGLGASLYALCGFASVLAGTPFLTNILPFGTFRDVWSGGLTLVENAGVTLAVTGGFVVLFIEFLEETRVVSQDDGE